MAVYDPEGARREVVRANRAFYDAFEARDLDALAALSVCDATASCVHPGWDPLRGWEAVRQSWEAIFRNTEWIRFTLTEVEVSLSGTLAVVRLVENIVSSAGGRQFSGRTAATNVFVHGRSGWLMLHHHASPTTGPEPDEDEEHPTLH